MSYILSIHSPKAFKSFLLPAINNTEHSIILSKDTFMLDEDVELLMEVIGGKWRFLPSSKLFLKDTRSGENCTGRTITDGDIMTLVTATGANLSIMVDAIENSFRVMNKYLLAGITQITVGKGENNDIVFDNRKIISSEHAVIHTAGNQWVIEDRSANGVFINSARLVGSRQLIFGDCISIFGLTIVFLGNVIAVGSNVASVKINEDKLKLFQAPPKTETAGRRRAKSEKIIFRRSPRPIYKIETEPVEIESPPNPKEIEKKPIGMIIGPSMTMALPMILGCGLAIYSTMSSGRSSSAFMYTGLITAISSATLGTVWAITNLIFERKKTRAQEMHRFEAYGEYLIKCSNQIKEKYEKNLNNLNAMYRPAEECCLYSAMQPALWNRNVSHSDFMTHRLGMGDMPFQVDIQVPREKFTMINDSLAEKPAMIRDSYRMLHGVPICADFADSRIIGIIGGEKKRGAVDVMHSLVAQIATSNCYTDVKMAFLYDEGEDDSDNWDYLKWLPHVWSEDKKTRFVAKDKTEAGDVLYEITTALRIRSENRSGFASAAAAKLDTPQYILFVSDYRLLEGELITKYIRDDNNRDITVIFLVDSYENLPNSCTYIIQNDTSFRGAYRISDGAEDRIPVIFDYITDGQLENLARTLADIEVKETGNGGDIPSSLSFFDMYGIHRPEELDVADKWRKNRTYDSMKALVGQKAGGSDWYLDVHEKYHGPHGLVAGTTGSGKSETLQTYILSLAINYSPDDVGFFLIDYKGGGMAHLFDGLPHIIGQISNLSGNQVKRAMVSIKSENKRRQRIFNEHGVNNINLYTRMYKNNEATIAIPHMFIVIDEFAELKREEPEFMRELISVAQVGRSLGVHLILATQKPSGTVDDNIWSNSKFRLCLRVQDRQDSNDMLHRPDAAYITQAGRCYMQVGNDELFELFQSGFSGATYDEEYGNAKLDIARMISTTGKTALIGNRLMFKQKEAAKRTWIKSLMDVINANPGMEQLGGYFNAFADAGIEYPYNEYNAARLKDMIGVMAQLREDAEAVAFTQQQDDGEAATTLKDAVSGASELTPQAIIAYAEENKIKLPEKKEKTQLDAVVEYLGHVAEEEGYKQPMQLWLPVLPPVIHMQELPDYSEDAYYNGNNWPKPAKDWNIEVPMGKFDDPVNQTQDMFSVNLSTGGHHAIIGTVVSGKSTFLQSFVYGLTSRYTPNYVNIYSIDYSAKMLSAFAKMPHVGGVILEGEDDKLAKFFNMISTILEDRKKLFKGGNYSQYVRVNGVTVPAIVICIDNYSNFKGKTDDKYGPMIMQLAKEGVSYGIFLMMTAGGFGTAEIPSRLGENLRTTICLELTDKYQYSEALHCMHIDTLPEANIKGRGLAFVGESLLEFQTALSFAAADDFSRMTAIEQLADKMRASWHGKCARPIPEIPENPVWAEFETLDDYASLAADDRHLPVAYNEVNAAAYGVDLSKTYCYLVEGKTRTGKTNFLKALMNAAASKGGRLVVFDYSGDLTGIANKLNAGAGTDGDSAEIKNGGYNITLIDSDEAAGKFFGDLIPDFKERNQKKKALEAEGKSDDEIFEEMQSFEKQYFFIANLPEFVNRAVKPEAGATNASAFVKNILEKGRLHNVFWFACYNPDESMKMAGNELGTAYISYKTGIYFGGNVSAQRILDFSYVHYSLVNQTLKPGIGMIPAGNDEETRKVIVPLVK